MSRTPDLMAKVSLLRTAEEVFAEKGLENAKVEEIAKRAGLSKGSFYLHFTSKEEAFQQVVESFLARCSSLIPEPDQDVPKDADGALGFMYEHDLSTFEYFWQSRDFLRIMESCNGDQAYLRDAFLDDTVKNSQRWVRTWQALGLFRPDADDGVAASLICGGYRELVRRMTAAEKKPPIGEWLRDSQRVFVRGLGTDELIRAQERRDVAHRSKGEVTSIDVKKKKAAARGASRG
ncbi:MAG TPA: helix-turn-helix domain-containing protein [Polyangiaceae bacterium]